MAKKRKNNNKLRYHPFRFHYPKLTILLIVIILTYYIFSRPSVFNYLNHLANLSYLSFFIAGTLFSFGFLTPLMTGFFIASNPEHIVLAAMIAGLGAAFSNLLIFSFVRLSFIDEINRLENTKLLKMIRKEVRLLILHERILKKLKWYFLYAFAGFLIASPLPNEFGDILLASIKKIRPLSLMILSFILSTFGILFLLLL